MYVYIFMYVHIWVHVCLYAHNKSAYIQAYNNACIQVHACTLDLFCLCVFTGGFFKRWCAAAKKCVRVPVTV